MTSPLCFSLIFTSYNNAPYLRLALDSALTQTYPHREIIVVDDGSTDESRQIIRSYGDKIHAIFQENLGQSEASNSGYRRASGDLIWFIDSDDVILPKALEHVAEAFIDPLTVMVGGQCRFINSEGTPLSGRAFALPVRKGDLSRELIRESTARLPSTSGLIYRKSALDRIMPVPGKYLRNCTDGYLRILMPFLGHINILPHTLYDYRRHHSNASSRFHQNIEGIRRDHFYSNLIYRYVRRLARNRMIPTPPHISSFSLTHLWKEILIRKAKHRPLTSALNLAGSAFFSDICWSYPKRLFFIACILVSALLPTHEAIRLYQCIAHYRDRH